MDAEGLEPTPSRPLDKIRYQLRYTPSIIPLALGASHYVVTLAGLIIQRVYKTLPQDPYS